MCLAYEVLGPLLVVLLRLGAARIAVELHSEACAACHAGGWWWCNSGAALERAAAGQPVAVLINGSGRAFQFYKGGGVLGPLQHQPGPVRR